ncbi:hypothetical protein KUL118_01650 [Tenacibaculum sp. KUL118]|nr:hypothetical protein KUL118_01650 [Tenacibaculum sp. KUL118]
MKKILAETTKSFMLMTRFGIIEAFRPSVIGHCTEVDQFVSQQQVKVLDNDLPENATDEEFKKFLDSHEGDWETALENFKLSLKGVEETEEGDKEDADKETDEGDKEDSPESEPAPKKTTTRTTKAKS